MKSLSLNTVISAYQRNAKCTSNKFWGVLGILCSVNSSIRPGVSYQFEPYITAHFLEELFCLGNPKDFSNMRNFYYVMFSKRWIDKIHELMCSYTPNFFDVAIWFFRNKQFPQIPTNSELIKLFSLKTGLSHSDINELFTFESRKLEYVDMAYKNFDLLTSLAAIFGNPNRYNSISAEGTFIKANPGEFSRAPFIQTIYAAQRAPECLLLTQFDVLKSYSLKTIDKL